MSMSADVVASLPSGLIDRLVRAALTSPVDLADDEVSRFAARLLLELADRDDDAVLVSYLALDPSDPPTFGVRVSKVGAERADEELDGLGAARALRAAAARVGIDDQTTVEVIAHEHDAAPTVVFRAGPGASLAFVPARRPITDIGAVAHAATDHEGPAVIVDIARDDLVRAIGEAVSDLSVQVEVNDLSTTVAAAVDRALEGRALAEGPMPDVPSVDEIAAAVLLILPTASAPAQVPSVEEIAAAVRAELPAPRAAPEVPTAEEIAAAIEAAAPVVSRPPSASEIAAAVRSVLPLSSGAAGPSAEEIATAVASALPPAPAPPAPPTAAEIAAAVRSVMPNAASAHDIAALVRGAVATPPTATQIADAVRSAVPAAPTTAQVAEAVRGVVPTAEEVAARLAARTSGVDAIEVAEAVLARLPAQPTAEELATRVVAALPELPVARDVAAAVAAVVPSADDIARRATPARAEVSRAALVEALEPLLADAIRPLLPTPRDVATELVPELERLWSRMEKTTLDRVLDVPRSSELDQLRAELRDLQEQLRSVRSSSSALTEEIVGSARRSREQIDSLSGQLGDDLHRWSRRLEERLAQLEEAIGRPAH